MVAGMGRDEKMAAVLDAMGYDEKGESYCVLRYGDKKHRRHDRVFYGAKAPFGFPIEAQSADYERWMEYLMSVSVSKIKERKWPVARFGWGFKYSNQSDFHPVCVYQRRAAFMPMEPLRCTGGTASGLFWQSLWRRSLRASRRLKHMKDALRCPGLTTGWNTVMRRKTE